MKVFGTTYKKLCAVVIGTSSGIHLQFGSIEDIFVNDEEVLFSVKKYTTLYYSEHHLLFRRLVNFVLYISVNSTTTYLYMYEQYRA